MNDDLAMVAYEAYRKMAGGPPFHQLTPEQRTAWRDVVDAVDAELDLERGDVDFEER